MDRLVVGVISKAQGVKGEVKIAPLTDDVSRFKKLSQVYIDGVCRKVSGVKILPNGIFMSIEGIVDRNGAETLRGKELVIDRKDAVELPKDRYFIVDVIGCEVSVGGDIVGKIVEVLQHGAADVYVIQGEKARYMIPAIDRVVKQVDISQKLITLDKSAWQDLAIQE